jgi:hypothetical protein
MIIEAIFGFGILLIVVSFAGLIGDKYVHRKYGNRKTPESRGRSKIVFKKD